MFAIFYFRSPLICEIISITGCVWIEYCSTSGYSKPALDNDNGICAKLAPTASVGDFLDLLLPKALSINWYQVEEIDWTSFYHCIQFPLNSPCKALLEKTENKSMWRRQYQEGPIDDRWTNLRLDEDESSGRLRIVEARKEWYLVPRPLTPVLPKPRFLIAFDISTLHIAHSHFAQCFRILHLTFSITLGIRNTVFN
jgi:hypothetical protein